MGIVYRARRDGASDPVAVKLAEDRWWISIADSDLMLWVKGIANGWRLDVLVDEPDVSPLAIQGPKSDDLMARVFGDSILVEQTAGDVIYDGNNINDVIPQKRDFGIVFQSYALFPNMTVHQNVSFGLKMRKMPPKLIEERVSEILQLVGLTEWERHYPSQLSGGQQQRVALGRALAIKPKVLLLDEPLSALDAKIRTKLQDDILAVHREFGLTTLLISHDVTEIIKMSDYVVEIEQGRIIRRATPSEIFTNEKLNAKFQFTGEVMKMTRQDFIVIVTVLVGRELVKVVANDSEVDGMEVGDQVLILTRNGSGV